MIANTSPGFRGCRSGICDYLAVRLLKWSSICQSYVSNGIDGQPGLFSWSVWFVWSISCIWLNETNQMNQTNQINQMNQIDQPVQNRTERSIPTLVFSMELALKFSLRLERCTPANP